MLRHSTPALAIAILTLAAACSSDTITQPAIAAPAVPTPLVQLDTARGHILSADSLAPDAGVVLLTDAGDTLRLVGSVADILAGSPNVELWVQGQINLDGSMNVVNYALRDVNDAPLCDGTAVRVILPEDGGCSGFAMGMKPNARATYARRK